MAFLVIYPSQWLTGAGNLGHLLCLEPLLQAGWGGVPTKDTEPDWTLNNLNYLENMNRIEAMARLLAGRKIHLVLVNFPTNPAYKA